MESSTPVTTPPTNPIVGINAPPWLVGFLRALLYLVLGAILSALDTYFKGASVPQELSPWVPIVLAAIRALEGVLDQLRKPKQNNTPPAQNNPPQTPTTLVGNRPTR